MASSWTDISFTGETQPSDLVNVYLADLRVNPGNSGGPAYLTETGAIIGIVHGNKLDDLIIIDPKTKKQVHANDALYNACLAIIIPARYIIDLLAKNGIYNK